MQNEIYRGLASQDEHDALIKMLDLTFFTNDTEVPRRDFLSILPKLYKREYAPHRNNYIIREGSEICAAVGFYTTEINMAGESIVCSGIGNVAVHPDHRSKGYMIECMNGAIEKMNELGADMSMLGGQRQRYGYFGFEPAGVGVKLAVNPTNVRHIFGKGAESGVELRALGEGDRGIFEKIDALYRAKPLYTVRPMEQYYDILRSWRCEPFAAFEGGEFVGYCVLRRGNSVAEIAAVDAERLRRLVFAIVERAGESVTINLPQFDHAAVKALLPMCEYSSLFHPEMFMILNFERVIRGLMKVKASCESLCDGELTLLIHGLRADEKIKISVSGGEVTVGKCESKCDIELDKLEAMRLFFSLHSERRPEINPNARSWFPLPLYGYECDGV